ncbi:MAG TPA: patatin-like phospholipase family protein [Solirubrobacteraceae bacterium]|nr:patatin-like phospholipase family protein [Solirubrobacteraceae bacterium]
MLSIDGGGIRGIIPAMVLAELERRAGRPVARLFDLIAGTSTGGILAIALTRPGSDGEPMWSAQQVVDLYEHEGPTIFDRGKMHALHGIIDERYHVLGLEGVLARYCGDMRLGHAVTDILIPAYDVAKRNVFYFDSARARQEPSVDYPAKVVARATSAAPTYFEPLFVRGDEELEELVFVDGGIFANNPAMCAFAQAKRGRLETDVLLVSIGTGSQTRPLPVEELRHWGTAQWARPILHVVLDGVSEAIDQQLAMVLGAERYFRFQKDLTLAGDEIDDARPENIALLKQEAEHLIREQTAEIDHLAEELVSRATATATAP